MKPLLKKVRMCSINVGQNDPVDIRCGGPETLGFDFHLDPSLSIPQWKKVITEILDKKGFQSDSIRICRVSWEKGKVWSVNQVKRCINGYSIR